MPTPTEMLSQLHAIANDSMWLALAWHVTLLVALAAFVGGWRPSRRVAAALLALPTASVAVIAAVYGNPFNTLVFAGLAIALFSYARRIEPAPVARPPEDWEITVGHAFIAFGVFYPHFLEEAPMYLLAAPFGTLPCPTLAALVGFTLLAGGFSRAWNFTLVFFAVFYGTVGTIQLGVAIDAVLVLGGVTLAWLTARQMAAPHALVQRRPS